MKIATPLKSLALLGLTAFTLASPVSQAQTGFIYFGSTPSHPTAPNVNPWMMNPAMQQARFQAEMKQRHAELDKRQDAQMQRILQGMDNGRLTAREAAGLIREHLMIANLERRYLSDGRMGPDELADLEKRLKIAEQNIRFESRDREVTVTIQKNEPPRRDDIRHPGDYGYPGDYGRR